MIKIKKNLAAVIIVFAAILFVQLQPLEVQAQSSEHFDTKLTTTYSVDLSGVTRVEHAFEIRHLTPEYYIEKYNIKLNSSDISSVKVVNNGQITNPEVNQQDTFTEIDIDFPDQLLGVGKVRKFSITYLDPNIAQVNGQVLEAQIPAMNTESDYNEHKVLLVTPILFGFPTRITPENYDLSYDDSHVTLTYTDIQEQGVSAIFGSQQVFNMTIRYHLDNPNSQPAITQVSLPPDTPYQKVIYHSLDPRPKKIESDDDGNWIATYYLPASETVEVNILADVLVSIEQLHPWLNIEPLPQHVSRQTYWETGQPQIQELAATYTQPQQIYNYVVETLDYTEADLSKNLDRLGAAKALNNPQQATCQEFSDLFIALARANGIPARRSTGYAHSNDPNLQPLSLVSDVLHAWPEYYDKTEEKWKPIDPTWGDTMQGVDYFNQLDLKHVVFAYNGKSSKYPLAAGDYKLPDQETKDVQVSFGEMPAEKELVFSVDNQPAKLFKLISLPSWYQLTFENKTGRAWYHNQIKLNSLDENVIFDIPEESFDLLPWQKKHIAIKVFNKEHWLPAKDIIQLTLTNQDKKHEQQIEIKTIKPIQIERKQLKKFKDEPRQLYFGLGIFSSVFAVAAGSLLVFRHRQ